MGIILVALLALPLLGGPLAENRNCGLIAGNGGMM